MLYTQQQRDADKILAQQSAETTKKDKFSILCNMRDIAAAMREEITGVADLDAFAKLLHEGWRLKSSLGFGITNSTINQWYEQARKAGAQGGKLLGAGGGGFLLLMAAPECHEAIRSALNHPREIPFKIDHRGSRIIFISDRYSF